MSGDTITFSPTISTLKACPDVDTWLSKLATGQIADNSLKISDKGNAVVGSLPKR